MRFIYLDIENTIIDDLVNCNFLDENCAKIKRFIEEKPIQTLSFFTWGWKTKEEVDINIVNSMLIKLGKDPLNIGCSCRVFPKSFSVRSAIAAGWLSEEDFDRAIEPGMMAEFGISKLSCFVDLFSRTITETHLNAGEHKATVQDPLEVWLVDDLVEEKEVTELHGGRLKIILINPKDLP